MAGGATTGGKPATKKTIPLVFQWKPFHDEASMGAWLNRQDWKSGKVSPFPEKPAQLIRKALNLWFDHRDEPDSRIPDGQTGDLTDAKTAEAIKSFKRDIKNLPDLSKDWAGASFKPAKLQETDAELDWTTLYVLDRKAAKADGSASQTKVRSPDDETF